MKADQEALLRSRTWHARDWSADRLEWDFPAWRMPQLEAHLSLEPCHPAGGRAADRLERGPAGLGAVPVATRTLSESGAVGPWRRDQVELFSISKLITCMMEPDDEWLCMDFHFNTGALARPLFLELLTQSRLALQKLRYAP